MEWILKYVLLLALFFAGAAVFSFLEVVAYRLPRKMNYVSGRSICPACGETLKGWQLVPVVSFVLLRGKCGFCGARIPWSALVSEMSGGALLMLCFRFFAAEVTGFNILRALLVFALLAALYCVARIDAETMEIPNGLVLWCAACGVAAIFLFPEVTLLERGIGLVCVSVPLLLITLLIPDAFGGGDIKLMAACGLFLGWQSCLLAFFFALLGGGGCGAALMLTKKKGGRDHFAFGPFLCGGIALAVFAAEPVLAWYGGFFQF